MSYTAVTKQDAGWWIGWKEEVRCVNSHGESREDWLEKLRSRFAEEWVFCPLTACISHLA